MRRGFFLVLLVLLATSCTDGRSDRGTAPDVPATAQLADAADDRVERRKEREGMVVSQIQDRGVDDPAVLAAMRAVQRHRFVPDGFADQAYRDHPLPIGYGQTISQPYIVALMSSMLGVSAGDRVLEIGTGSGYQAAVLAEMDLVVFTIEIVSELADRASHVLSDLGYGTVTTREGDGYLGWEEKGPFKAIIVTAAPDHVPQPVVRQLAPDGRMVIPIGPVGAVQTLWMFSTDESGALLAQNLGSVRFVPLTRRE